MNKNFKTKKEKGFVILFAVLISSVVLLIALGIANIASNENILSSSAREAQNAFFAADTGAECALYWDIKQNYFPATGYNPSTAATCDSASKLSVTSGADSNGILSYTFQLDLNSNRGCVNVLIDKGYDPFSTGTPMTRIESRGYNVPCSAIITNPKAIERAVRLTY